MGEYHGSNDDAISREVAKGLEPPFKGGSVKRVGVVDELLEIFQGDLGRGRGMPQVLKETVKVVGPKANNDIAFLRYVFERCGNVGCQISRQLVEDQLGKAGKHVELIPAGLKWR